MLEKLIEDLRHTSDVKARRELTEKVARAINNDPVIQGEWLAKEGEKLDKVKAKFASGKRINVYFVVNYAAKFEFSTVYREMALSDHFAPHLLVVSPKDQEYAGAIPEAHDTYERLLNNGYSAVWGYATDDSPLDLSKLDIDILFINNPNMYKFSTYNNVILSYEYLSIYEPYSYHVVNKNRDYEFNSSVVNISWMIVAFSDYLLKRWQTYSKRGARNVFSGGDPKLDVFAQAGTAQDEVPTKFQNGNPIVIIAPHWSVETDLKMATFHIYFSLFEHLRQDHPDVNFVFKPHPDLPNRLRSLKRNGQTIGIGFDDYLQYLKNWNESDNGLYIDDGEYIGLFRQSALLITDSGSFIAEYLPSLHPCIYLLNQNREDRLNDFFTSEAMEILNDGYYCCTNGDEILAYFDQLMHDHLDPKRAKREELSRKMFPGLGSSAQKIVHHIEDVLSAGQPSFPNSDAAACVPLDTDDGGNVTIREFPVVGYTAGVFDLFHIGHLNLLRNARGMCDRLVVGVTTDELVAYKNKRAVIPFSERVEIVRSSRYVDAVVAQDDMDKLVMCKKLKAKVLFVGDDWYDTDKWNDYEKEFQIAGIRIVYFPYTQGVSSTLLNDVLRRLRDGE